MSAPESAAAAFEAVNTKFDRERAEEQARKSRGWGLDLAIQALSAGTYFPNHSKMDTVVAVADKFAKFIHDGIETAS
jgi:hypothetical protein